MIFRASRPAPAAISLIRSCKTGSPSAPGAGHAAAALGATGDLVALARVAAESFPPARLRLASCAFVDLGLSAASRRRLRNCISCSAGALGAAAGFKPSSAGVAGAAAGGGIWMVSRFSSLLDGGGWSEWCTLPLSSVHL